MGRGIMMAVDWAILERAAEQTISAATAALLWDGEDRQGVLDHVAGTTVARMVVSRVGYSVVCPEGFDETLPPDLWSAFEVAALPAAAAPAWAASVSAALADALQDSASGTRADWRGRIVPHSDATVRLRSVHGAARSRALWVCSLWGRDPLPLNLVENGARIVSYTALPSSI